MNDDRTFPSVAALASFTPTPNAAPPTVHVAVIEWPSGEGEPPRVVLSRTKDGIKAAAREEIADMLTAIDPERMVAFREAFTADPDNYIEHIMDGNGDHPWVSFYEQEV